MRIFHPKHDAMARKIDLLLEKYGESHQNRTNKKIHWVCVPIIFFTIVGFFMCLPWPWGEKTLWSNWTIWVGLCALIYYWRLSLSLALGSFLFLGICIFLNYTLLEYLGLDEQQYFWVLLIAFGGAWIGQFIGHHIEGKKPSFLDDLQFLLIGPAWLLHFLYQRWGMKY